MGKPYKTELAALENTYRWAMNLPIDPLAAAVSGAAGFPLLAVGSGGSFSAAHFASSLHQSHTGFLSKAVTPLDFVSTRFDPRSCAVLVLSASGNNVDIVGCLKNTVLREPSRCLALCLREESQLHRIATKFRFLDLVEVSSPTRQDGFLATNSLLAFIVLISRAYAQAFSADHGLPDSLKDLVPFQRETTRWQDHLRKICEPLWRRDTLLVLYSPALQSAAVDIESKFSEAALATIQLADFRNFAHGRHNWLAKRGDSTSVLVLRTDKDRRIAEKTTALLPKAIPIADIEFPSTTLAASGLASILSVLHIVDCAGEARNIDPGRPGIPEFGRRIYNLRAATDGASSRDTSWSIEDVAIARKLGIDVVNLSEQGHPNLDVWRNAYRTFVRSFNRVSFKGAVLDYDGTLCDMRDRFSGPGSEIVEILIHLLKNGLTIGIASGRGKSVRRDLQERIPKRLWSRVHLAYYNGAVIGRLDEEDVPVPNAAPSPVVKAVASVVEMHPILTAMATAEARFDQVSLLPRIPGTAENLWRITGQIIQPFPSVKAVISSHSVDILGPGVSKCRLVEHLQKEIAIDGHIIAIGDKGAWPGNDFELLRPPYSLSVDEVSAEPGSCWNLAPLGHRGSQAAIDYLRSLKLTRRGATLNCSRVGRRRAAWDES